jgi:hypothetical protein
MRLIRYVVASSYILDVVADQMFYLCVEYRALKRNVEVGTLLILMHLKVC